MAEQDTPALTKAPTTEMEGVEPVERRVMEAYVAKKGYVKDLDGRFHEVDDVERTLQAYPGFEKVKAGEVTKGKTGWANPPAAPEAPAQEG